jgi:hypothetical protein
MSGPEESVPKDAIVKPEAPKAKRLGRPKAPAVPPGSREAKRLAAVILEVLGGARLPAEAAGALNLTLARYYQLEARALAGLVAACEPRPIGRVASPERELTAAHKEAARWRQECARYQALARVAQRALGLQPPAAAKPKPDAKGRLRRKRKPSLRALKAAERLKSEVEAAPAAPPQVASAS